MAAALVSSTLALVACGDETGGVKGRFLRDGDPVARAGVTLGKLEKEEDFGSRETKTDSAGRFSFEDVAEGKDYGLAAGGGDAGCYTLDLGGLEGGLEVKPGETVTKNLHCLESGPTPPPQLPQAQK